MQPDPGCVFYLILRHSVLKCAHLLVVECSVCFEVFPVCIGYVYECSVQCLGFRDYTLEFDDYGKWSDPIKLTILSWFVSPLILVWVWSFTSPKSELHTFIGNIFHPASAAEAECHKRCLVDVGSGIRFVLPHSWSILVKLGVLILLYAINNVCTIILGSFLQPSQLNFRIFRISKLPSSWGLLGGWAFSRLTECFLFSKRIVYSIEHSSYKELLLI